MMTSTSTPGSLSAARLAMFQQPSVREETRTPSFREGRQVNKLPVSTLAQFQHLGGNPSSASVQLRPPSSSKPVNKLSGQTISLIENQLVGGRPLSVPVTEVSKPIQQPSLGVNKDTWFDCMVCYQKLQSKQRFDPEEASNLETHSKNPICVSCAEEYTKSQVKDLLAGSPVEILCPCGCKTKLKFRTLQTLLEHSKKELEILQLRSSQAALRNDPSFRWCCHPDCNSGQQTNEEVWICRMCEKSNCATHGFPALETTVSNVNGRFIKQRQTCCRGGVQELENLNNAYFQNETKKCPNCQFSIEKNGGCAHMTCRCGYEFFWCCLRKYRDQEQAKLHSQLC